MHVDINPIHQDMPKTKSVKRISSEIQPHMLHENELSIIIRVEETEQVESFMAALENRPLRLS